MDQSMVQTIVMVVLVLIFFGVGVAVRWYYDKKRDWTLPEIVEAVQQAIDNPTVQAYLREYPGIKNVIGEKVYSLLLVEKEDKELEEVLKEGEEPPSPKP